MKNMVSYWAQDPWNKKAYTLLVNAGKAAQRNEVEIVAAFLREIDGEAREAGRKEAREALQPYISALEQALVGAPLPISVENAKGEKLIEIYRGWYYGIREKVMRSWCAHLGRWLKI